MDTYVEAGTIEVTAAAWQCSQTCSGRGRGRESGGRVPPCGGGWGRGETLGLVLAAGSAKRVPEASGWCGDALVFAVPMAWREVDEKVERGCAVARGCQAGQMEASQQGYAGAWVRKRREGEARGRYLGCGRAGPAAAGSRRLAGLLYYCCGLLLIL